MNIKVLGIDLAKSVFQICALDTDNQVVTNVQVRRTRLLARLSEYPKGTLVAMEACATCHYWARQCEKMGFKVKVIPTQHVKPLTHTQKNDANDAVAIAEAAFRPKVISVPIKTLEQQNLKAWLCIRERTKANKLALGNQIRAIAAEYGVIFSVKEGALCNEVPLALESTENELTDSVRELLNMLLSEYEDYAEKIAHLTKKVTATIKQSEHYQFLVSIPGFGPIVSAHFLAEVGGGTQFSSGRGASAWVGITPKVRGSGGKNRTGSITKRGSCTLRKQLIHGARSVVRVIDKHDDPLSLWVAELVGRRGKNVATVALANKLMRIAWRVLTTHEKFDANKACAA